MQTYIVGIKKILDFTNRPYKNVEEMEEAFLDYYEKTLSKKDTLYLLGDICFYNHQDFLDKLFKALPTNDVHLIAGNHDPSKVRKYHKWKSVSDYKEIKVDKKLYILCHFPIESWRNQTHGAIHLHGHTHGNISHSINYIRNRLDVGYDNTNQILVSLEDIEALLRTESTKGSVKE